MSDENLTEMLTEEDNYAIIRILRNGPISEGAITKFFSVKSKRERKKIIKALSELQEKKVIDSFQFKDEKIYYLLIKDFYIIRVPPKPLLEYITKKKNIPTSLRNQYLQNVKSYFANYVKSTRKVKADFEMNLVKLLLDENIKAMLDILKRKPLPLDKVLKKYPVFSQIKDALLRADIIDIYAEGRESWVFLKTDLQLNFFFPEYLIKNVTENLRDKKLEKQIALHSLYLLKKNYLMMEKPEQYKGLVKRLENKEKLAQSHEKKGVIPLNLAKELKKLAKTVGDYEKRRYWGKKVKELQKKSKS